MTFQFERSQEEQKTPTSWPNASQLWSRPSDASAIAPRQTGQEAVKPIKVSGDSPSDIHSMRSDKTDTSSIANRKQDVELLRPFYGEMDIDFLNLSQEQVM